MASSWWTIAGTTLNGELHLPMAPRWDLVVSRALTQLSPTQPTPRTESPELALRAPSWIGWTRLDGLYDICHVAPRDVPMTRTGASSGTSKRYQGVHVLLTHPLTLPHLTFAS